MNKVFLALRCAAVIAIVAAAFASDWALANHYILCERAQKCIVVEPPLVDSGTSIDANIPDRVCPCDFGVARSLCIKRQNSCSAKSCLPSGEARWRSCGGWPLSNG